MVPSPQQMYAVIDTGTKSMMLSNWSEHPVTIERVQQLRITEPVLFGCKVHRTGSHINWNNLVDSQATVHANRGVTPVAGEQDCFHVELQPPDSRVAPRPLRSILDSEAATILTTAPPRIKGELLLPEDDDDNLLPEISPFTQETPLISPYRSNEQRKEIDQGVTEFSNGFSHDKTIGHVRDYSVPINTDNNQLPPPQAPRPTGPVKRTAIDTAIEELLQWDVIEPSTSPTASPVLLVWQNNKWRFCVDYQRVNTLRISDVYPLLRPDYIFSVMANRQYFTVFNAVKGYHQVDIDRDDRHKTAFICHQGLFQYKRLPFGQKNTQGQYQRLMDRVLGSLRWTAALWYIDNAIVFSMTCAEHVAHVRRFLTAIRASGLQLTSTKCWIGYPDVTMLGMQISRYGLATTEEKVTAVTALPVPTTMAVLDSVVGMFGYYRNFIRNFSRIAKPLNDPKKVGKYTPEAKII
jgi:hypothetical protein